MLGEVQNLEFCSGIQLFVKVFLIATQTLAIVLFQLILVEKFHFVHTTVVAFWLSTSMLM